MHNIPIRQIMTAAVITIQPTALIVDAATVMNDLHLRRMPVLDETGSMIGIITDSDVREAETVEQARNSYEPSSEADWLTVADVMSREVVTIQPDATVGELAALLMQHKIGGVPVIESNETADVPHRLVGIVTETDIFRMIANAWEKEKQEIASKQVNSEQ